MTYRIFENFLKQYLILFFILFFVTAKGQRMWYDRTKDGVRIVETYGKTFDINMRSHKVSLSAYVHERDTSYTLNVLTYSDIPDTSKLVFTLFDGETISLNSIDKKDGYTVMICYNGILPYMPFANTMAVYSVTPEQLAKLSSYGIQRMDIDAESYSRGRKWKKDKLGVFLKKAFDKLKTKLTKE